MTSLVEKLQDFLEADLKRPINSAELKVLRRFVTDFQNAKEEVPKQKARGEIVTEGWKPQSTPVQAADGDIKPVVKQDAKIFSRVAAWANMASSESSTKSSKGASDLPVQVGLKDRLGSWQAKEGGSPGETSKTSKPADLDVDVGIKGRLGTWKDKEAGKTAEVSVSPRAEMPESSLGVKDRLGKWKEAESGAAAPSSPARKEQIKLVPDAAEEEGAPPPAAAAPLRQRLASYQQTVEEKEKGGQRAKDAHAEVSEATPVAARKDHWAQIETTGDSKPVTRAVVPNAEEGVHHAPSVKDRMKNLEAASTEKQVEKEAVVVPYDDDYKPPQPPTEENQPVPVASRKDPVKVEGASGLKERMEAFAKATEEKPIAKTEVKIDEEQPTV